MDCLGRNRMYPVCSANFMVLIHGFFATIRTLLLSFLFVSPNISPYDSFTHRVQTDTSLKQSNFNIGTHPLALRPIGEAAKS